MNSKKLNNLTSLFLIFFIFLNILIYFKFLPLFIWRINNIIVFFGGIYILNKYNKIIDFNLILIILSVMFAFSEFIILFKFIN